MISKIRRGMKYFFILLFHFLPRNKHIWITGKTTSWYSDFNPPAFFDNSKYFFLYLNKYTKEKVFWLSSSGQEIEMLRKMDLPVIKYPSIRGIYLTLRAKFFFHHYGTDQIDEDLQKGSVQLDFWHGTPIKKIRYDVVKKEEKQNSIINRILKKGGIEYVSSTSLYLSEIILARAFDVPLSNMINFGYPRMDIMKLDKQSNYTFCQKYSPELIPLIDKAQNYSCVFLYMPTWRDDDPEYFKKAAIDYDSMSKALKKINGVFFLKLHPLTKHSMIKQYDNIIQIGNDVDIYPFLIYTNYLITDYSSIYFDFLPLDREIIFIPYDYDHYVANRELYFNYDEITPGKKYYSFSDFIDGILTVNDLDYSNERKRVRDLMIENYHFDACEKTYKFIKERYQ